MPLSIVSTTSAWRSASRAAQRMASVGVASADGSRWRGRPGVAVRGLLGQQALGNRARSPVKKMKSTASATLKPRWNSTTCWPVRSLSR